MNEWLEIGEATAIVSRNSGRAISPDYVRILAHQGRIAWMQKNKRQNYYLRSDAEKIYVQKRQRKDLTHVA